MLKLLFPFCNKVFFPSSKSPLKCPEGCLFSFFSVDYYDSKRCNVQSVKYNISFCKMILFH